MNKITITLHLRIKILEIFINFIWLCSRANQMGKLKKYHCMINRISQGVLQKTRSQKFCKIRREAPVSESLFKKDAGLQTCNFIKETLAQVFSCEICEIFQNTYFHRPSSVAAPVTLLKKRPWHRCFPVNFARFLRAPFSFSTCGDCFESSVWGKEKFDDWR